MSYQMEDENEEIFEHKVYDFELDMIEEEPNNLNQNDNS